MITRITCTAFALGGLVMAAPTAVASDHRPTQPLFIVKLDDSSFSPRRLTIPRGAKVRFTWVSGYHNVTRERGPAFRNVPDRSTGTMARVFHVRGTFALVCTNHADLGMRIVIRVK